MLFFISQVFADGNTPQQSLSLLSVLPIVAFVAILYFLIILPQKKMQKRHQALISSIKKGDKVITNGGIIAVVDKVESDREVILEIDNGVKCRFVKTNIVSIINNNTTDTTTSNTIQQNSEDKKG